MKKVGFNVKLDNEKLLYIGVVILIAVFVLNLKNIYNFTVKLKSGDLFKKNGNSQVVQPSEPNPTPEQPKYESIDTVGDLSLTCKVTENQENIVGTKYTEVYIYGEENKIKSIKQVVKYEGSSEDYTNYIYSQSSKYDELREKNKVLKGFSVVTDMPGNLSFKSTIVIDLTKNEINEIENISSLIVVSGYLDENINSIKELYENGGFYCE